MDKASAQEVLDFIDENATIGADALRIGVIALCNASGGEMKHEKVRRERTEGLPRVDPPGRPDNPGQPEEDPPVVIIPLSE